MERAEVCARNVPFLLNRVKAMGKIAFTLFVVPGSIANELAVGCSYYQCSPQHPVFACESPYSFWIAQPFYRVGDSVFICLSASLWGISDVVLPESSFAWTKTSFHTEETGDRPLFGVALYRLRADFVGRWVGVSLFFQPMGKVPQAAQVALK
jgi:hypothetical protein